ncbi:tRNA-binding protein [Faecalibacter bovis]|uniref:tRNA-binding protein n=1 Tax=Faecalibacter bovis TaxID=2898187 RepID=A0ABX7XGI1_9FLAO|nr:tRNA-binding protein [Faecalibacter bovis]
MSDDLKSKYQHQKENIEQLLKEIENKEITKDVKNDATISWQDFEKIDMRVGTIIKVEDFPEARNPAYQLTIDFGPLGLKKSSAQITSLYTKEELINQQIIAVVNFPPKQIGKFMSECLVMGVYGNDKDVILLNPQRKVENGWKIG